MAIIFTTAVIPTMKKPLLFGAIRGTVQALGIVIMTMIVYSISKWKSGNNGLQAVARHLECFTFA